MSAIFLKIIARFSDFHSDFHFFVHDFIMLPRFFPMLPNVSKLCQIMPNVALFCPIMSYFICFLRFTFAFSYVFACFPACFSQFCCLSLPQYVAFTHLCTVYKTLYLLKKEKKVIFYRLVDHWRYK